MLRKDNRVHIFLKENVISENPKYEKFKEKK